VSQAIDRLEITSTRRCVKYSLSSFNSRDFSHPHPRLKSIKRALGFIISHDFLAGKKILMTNLFPSGGETCKIIKSCERKDRITTHSLMGLKKHKKVKGQDYEKVYHVELSELCDKSLLQRTNECSDDSNETIVYRRQRTRSTDENSQETNTMKSPSKKVEDVVPVDMQVLLTSNKRVRSAFEAQFLGNTQAIVDDLEYILDGLVSIHDVHLRTRTCMVLLKSIENVQYFSVFKARNLAEIALARLIIKHEEHQPLISVIMCFLSKLTESDSDAIWLAQWIVNQSSREVIHLLHLAIQDHITKSTLFSCGIEKDDGSNALKKTGVYSVSGIFHIKATHLAFLIDSYCYI
jgi:DNA-directed RNA polymerase subunit M/transcription elongation factor TFIIS